MSKNGSASSAADMDGGVRGVAIAMMDAIFGTETIEAFNSAVALLSSANDLANGKVPKGRTTRGELEADLDDI